MKGRPHKNGFTLIELLIVVVILSLASSLVVLSMPEGSADLRREAEKLAARLHYAQQESVLSGEAMGLAFSYAGYRFLRRRQGDWQAPEAGSLFGAEDWASAERIVVWVDHQLIEPGSEEEAAEIAPDFVFDPLMPGGALDVELQARGVSYEVHLRSDGQVNVERRNED